MQIVAVSGNHVPPTIEAGLELNDEQDCVAYTSLYSRKQVAASPSAM